MVLSKEQKAKHQLVRDMNRALAACDESRYGDLKDAPILYVEYPLDGEFLVRGDEQGYAKRIANVTGDSPTALMRAFANAVERR